MTRGRGDTTGARAQQARAADLPAVNPEGEPMRVARPILIALSLLLALSGPALAEGGAYRPGQSWQRVQFPDGSGGIALPPG
jgi:hypothetical protein